MGRPRRPWSTVSASYVRVDGANGFSQLALEASEPAIRTSLAETGLAVVAARDSHHFSALWPDLEPYARDGYVSLAMISSGTLMVMPRGTSTPVFGTNPFAFATPVDGAPPLGVRFRDSIDDAGDQRTVREPSGGASPLSSSSACVSGGRICPNARRVPPPRGRRVHCAALCPASSVENLRRIRQPSAPIGG